MDCLTYSFISWQFLLCPCSLYSLIQVPFTTMLALLCMWFGISMPLVYLGYYFGFRKQPYDNPVRTNQIPRQVPEQRWYMNKFVGWVFNQSNNLLFILCQLLGWLMATLEHLNIWVDECLVIKCFFFFFLPLESWWLGSCLLVPCSLSFSLFSVWVQLLYSECIVINSKQDHPIFFLSVTKYNRAEMITRVTQLQKIIDAKSLHQSFV